MVNFSHNRLKWPDNDYSYSLRNITVLEPGQEERDNLHGDEGETCMGARLSLSHRIKGDTLTSHFTKLSVTFTLGGVHGTNGLRGREN